MFKHKVLIVNLIKPETFLDNFELSVGNVDQEWGADATTDGATVRDNVIAYYFLFAHGKAFD